MSTTIPYVTRFDTSGLIHNYPRSTNDPYTALSEAITDLQDGDTLFLKSQTVFEVQAGQELTISNSGISVYAEGSTLRRASGDDVCLTLSGDSIRVFNINGEGSDVVTPVGSPWAHLIESSGENNHIEGCKFTNGNWTTASNGGEASHVHVNGGFCSITSCFFDDPGDTSIQVTQGSCYVTDTEFAISRDPATRGGLARATFIKVSVDTGFTVPEVVVTNCHFHSLFDDGSIQHSGPAVVGVRHIGSIKYIGCIFNCPNTSGTGFGKVSNCRDISFESCIVTTGSRWFCRPELDQEGTGPITYSEPILNYSFSNCDIDGYPTPLASTTTVREVVLNFSADNSLFGRRTGGHDQGMRNIQGIVRANFRGCTFRGLTSNPSFVFVGDAAAMPPNATWKFQDCLVEATGTLIHLMNLVPRIGFLQVDGVYREGSTSNTFSLADNVSENLRGSAILGDGQTVYYTRDLIEPGNITANERAHPATGVGSNLSPLADSEGKRGDRIRDDGAASSGWYHDGSIWVAF